MFLRFLLIAAAGFFFCGQNASANPVAEQKVEILKRPLDAIFKVCEGYVGSSAKRERHINRSCTVALTNASIQMAALIDNNDPQLAAFRESLTGINSCRSGYFMGNRNRYVDANCVGSVVNAALATLK